MRINLQLFAALDDVIAANKAAFEGSNIKDNFAAISTKLNELGYDMLINNKKSAEFVPSSRLSDVVGQRDQFKNQADQLAIDLQKMKDAAKGNEALQNQIQGLMDTNNKLLKDLEQSKVHNEIIAAAKDAVNAKDLIVFVNMDAIKINSKGEVLGVEAEIQRLKTEKPYLFQTAGTGKKKAGLDNTDKDGDKGSLDMNVAIRRAAGR